MRAKDQLYQYVEKRKQKIIDQYDRTLERINWNDQACRMAYSEIQLCGWKISI